MKTIPIYTDKTQIVSINCDVHRNLLMKQLVMKELSKWNANLLISIVIKELEGSGFRNSGQHMEYSKQMPVLIFHRLIKVMEPFDSMTFAMNFITTLNNEMEIEDINENLNKAKEDWDIEGEYFLKFFDKPICEANGYCAYKENNEIRIMFFNFDELNAIDIDVY